jgi:hypothetical protein
MDANAYLLESLVREQLAARRLWARQTALVSAGRRSGRPAPWRAALGLVLIRLGRALAGEPARHTRHA